MKIKKLSVKYHPTGLEIQNVEFDDTLSLLVGISGVGKTSILKAIKDIINIANGDCINGFEWDVDFEFNNFIYKWTGKFEYSEEEELRKNYSLKLRLKIDRNIKVVYETLTVNGNKILDRKDDDIYFKNEKTVKLGLFESAISLLKEEDVVKTVYDEFSKILSFYNNSKDQWSSILDKNEYDSFFEKVSDKDFESIISLKTELQFKIYYFFQRRDNIFEKFLDTYKQIFPYVEDIKVVLSDVKLHRTEYVILELEIKEYGLDNWISLDSISTGMFKTLFYLASIFFSPKGFIFLIDEFENGFGVNCINSIAEWVLSAGLDYQFIMTSHHPYIINNIPVKKWKIVNRSKNIITAESAVKHIDASNHDAFIKLINSNFYTQGVEVNSNNNDLTEDDLYS